MPLRNIVMTSSPLVGIGFPPNPAATGCASSRSVNVRGRTGPKKAPPVRARPKSRKGERAPICRICCSLQVPEGPPMSGHAIHIKVDGRTYSGTYKVDRHILTVTTNYGRKAAEVGPSSAACHSGRSASPRAGSRGKRPKRLDDLILEAGSAGTCSRRRRSPEPLGVREAVCARRL